MRDNLRKAWTEIIQPDDYDAHMAAVGQAQANAALVADYLNSQLSNTNASILFVGAGTGQMFDFVSPNILRPFSVTFADINTTYLERLSARLTPVKGLVFKTQPDDIEQTKISRRFGLVVATLVLEHVDWRKAVAIICSLAARDAFVVIQENPPDAGTAMNPTRQIPSTMKIFKDVHPTLISPADLDSEFERHSFSRSYSTERQVADAKKMLARAFTRSNHN